MTTKASIADNKKRIEELKQKLANAKSKPVVNTLPTGNPTQFTPNEPIAQITLVEAAQIVVKETIITPLETLPVGTTTIVETLPDGETTIVESLPVGETTVVESSTTVVATQQYDRQQQRTIYQDMQSRVVKIGAGVVGGILLSLWANQLAADEAARQASATKVLNDINKYQSESTVTITDHFGTQPGRTPVNDLALSTDVQTPSPVIDKFITWGGSFFPENILVVGSNPVGKTYTLPPNTIISDDTKYMLNTITHQNLEKYVRDPSITINQCLQPSDRIKILDQITAYLEEPSSIEMQKAHLTTFVEQLGELLKTEPFFIKNNLITLDFVPEFYPKKHQQRLVILMLQLMYYEVADNTILKRFFDVLNVKLLEPKAAVETELNQLHVIMQRDIIDHHMKAFLRELRVKHDQYNNLVLEIYKEDASKTLISCLAIALAEITSLKMFKVGGILQNQVQIVRETLESIYASVPTQVPVLIGIGTSFLAIAYPVPTAVVASAAATVTAYVTSSSTVMGTIILTVDNYYKRTPMYYELEAAQRNIKSRIKGISNSITVMKQVLELTDPNALQNPTLKAPWFTSLIEDETTEETMKRLGEAMAGGDEIPDMPYIGIFPNMTEIKWDKDTIITIHKPTFIDTRDYIGLTDVKKTQGSFVDDEVFMVMVRNYVDMRKNMKKMRLITPTLDQFGLKELEKDGIDAFKQIVVETVLGRKI